MNNASVQILLIKTQEEQIQELTEQVMCRIAPSPISGVGIFAIRDIKKGEKLHCALEEPRWYTVSFDNLKKLPQEVRQLILDRWSEVVVGSPFLSPNHDAIMTSFMNHSNEPNYEQKSDTALCDIKAGEEIFEDYRLTRGWRCVYPWIRDE